MNEFFLTILSLAFIVCGLSFCSIFHIKGRWAMAKLLGAEVSLGELLCLNPKSKRKITDYFFKNIPFPSSLILHSNYKGAPEKLLEIKTWKKVLLSISGIVSVFLTAIFLIFFICMHEMYFAKKCVVISTEHYGAVSEVQLETGDVIRKINGKVLANYRDFCKVVLSANQIKSVQIERNGFTMGFITDLDISKSAEFGIPEKTLFGVEFKGDFTPANTLEAFLYSVKFVVTESYRIPLFMFLSSKNDMDFLPLSSVSLSAFLLSIFCMFSGLLSFGALLYCLLNLSLESLRKKRITHKS